MTAPADPVTAAWEAYDLAMLALHRMYALHPPPPAKMRVAQAQHTARVWEAWRTVFLQEGPHKTGCALRTGGAACLTT